MGRDAQAATDGDSVSQVIGRDKPRTHSYHVWLHRVPGPSRVVSDLSKTIPIISGATVECQSVLYSVRRRTRVLMEFCDAY